MPMPVELSLLTVLLAAAFGFLTRWANICIVHAGERWLIHGRADVLFDFASCAAWSGLLLLPLAWMLPGEVQLAPYAIPALPLLAGALLFGFGASVNGACAFGTVAKIGAGELALLFSIPGYAAGLALGRSLGGMMPAMQASPVSMPNAFAWIWLAVLGLIGAAELRAILRAPHTSSREQRRQRDRLALIAMSLCGGLLFSMVHNSIYGRAVEPGVRWLARIPGMYEWSGLALLLAVLLGASLAGFIRSEWKLRPPRVARSLRALMGGVLMGAGAACVPGGNDFLVLWGAPSAALDALCALPLMVAGVLLGLRLGGARRALPAG
jgi:hypothetical protein